MSDLKIHDRLGSYRYDVYDLMREGHQAVRLIIFGIAPCLLKQ